MSVWKVVVFPVCGSPEHISVDVKADQKEARNLSQDLEESIGGQVALIEWSTFGTRKPEQPVSMLADVIDGRMVQSGYDVSEAFKIAMASEVKGDEYARLATGVRMELSFVTMDKGEADSIYNHTVFTVAPDSALAGSEDTRNEFAAAIQNGLEGVECIEVNLLSYDTACWPSDLGIRLSKALRAAGHVNVADLLPTAHPMSYGF